MNCFKSFLLGLVVYSSTLAGCYAASSTTAERHNFVHDGIDRTYSIYIPQDISKSQRVALVIALHGGGGSDKKWPSYTNYGFERLADRERFILVYPNGLEGHWNDGRGVARYKSQREGVDDSGFLARLIDDLAATYPVDKGRIYVVGASNGGMMAHKLAAEYSDKVTAIATVISAIPQNIENTLRPTHPVSVLMINGTEDPLVPWDGGLVKFGRKKNGYVISTDQTVKFWTDHNRCTPSATTTDLPDVSPNDGTKVTRTSYESCQSGSKVVLYKVIGGGHTWPAYKEKRKLIGKLLLDKLVGKRSKDIDACQVIWQFFKSQSNRT